jgi:hypothetical protein
MIIFYKSDSTQSRENSSVDSWEQWMMKQEDSGDEKDNDVIAHFFEKKNLKVGTNDKLSKRRVKTRNQDLHETMK